MLQTPKRLNDTYFPHLIMSTLAFSVEDSSCPVYKIELLVLVVLLQMLRMPKHRMITV